MQNLYNKLKTLFFYYFYVKQEIVLFIFLYILLPLILSFTNTIFVYCVGNIFFDKKTGKLKK